MSKSSKTSLAHLFRDAEKAHHAVLNTSIALQDCVSKNCKDSDSTMLKALQIIGDPKTLMTEDNVAKLLKSLKDMTYDNEAALNQCMVKECLQASEALFLAQLAFFICRLKCTEAINHAMTEKAVKSSKSKSDNKSVRSKKTVTASSR